MTEREREKLTFLRVCVYYTIYSMDVLPSAHNITQMTENEQLKKKKRRIQVKMKLCNRMRKSPTCWLLLEKYERRTNMRKY